MHRKRLSGNGCLIHHTITFQYHPVQRNHIAGADHDRIVLSDLINPGQNLLPVRCSDPDFVHVQ